MILMDSASLTDDQRGWLPTTAEEATTQWPTIRHVEIWEGQLLYWAASGAEWDWRSVAMAARTFPGALIELRQEVALAVIFRQQSAQP